METCLASFRLALAGGKRGAEGVFRKEWAVSRVAKSSNSLLTVTFAVFRGSVGIGLQLCRECKFLRFLKKSLETALDRNERTPCRMNCV